MSEPFIGEIRTFGFTYAPQQWTFCAGQFVTVSENDALFSLLGTNYGGDGRVTFGLPNLTSRMPMGCSMGTPNPPDFQSYPIGFMVGNQIHTLTTPEMPRHNHPATFTSSGGGGSAKLEATTEEGEASTPGEGMYLSQTKSTGGPQDQPENIYKSNPTPGSLVTLGGVSGGGGSGGSVTVDNNGGRQSFAILNPVVALNFSIALLGIYPSRN